MQRSKTQYYYLFMLMFIMAYPAFMIFFLVADILIFPAVFYISDIYVQITHADIGARIEFQKDLDAWALTSNLFQARTDFSDGEIAPQDFFIEGQTFQNLESASALIYGLPILWILISSMVNNKIKSLIIGSIAQTLFISIAMCLHITYTLLNSLSRDIEAKNLMVFYAETTINHVAIPTWELTYLKPVYESMVMMSMVGVPFLITYGLLVFNKQSVNIND